MEPVLIPLAKIVRDEDLQMRVSTDFDHVDAIKEAITEKVELPPVDVWQEKDTELYFLGDGHHRYIAHELLGKKEMLCNIHQGGRDAALEYAFGANREHNALRRTTKDKQKALAKANKHHPKLSIRKLAELVGVGKSMVHRYREELKKCPNGTPDKDPDTDQGGDNPPPPDPQQTFFNTLDRSFETVMTKWSDVRDYIGWTNPDIDKKDKLAAVKDLKLNLKKMLKDIEKREEQITNAVEEA